MDQKVEEFTVMIPHKVLFMVQLEEAVTMVMKMLDLPIHLLKLVITDRVIMLILRFSH